MTVVCIACYYVNLIDWFSCLEFFSDLFADARFQAASIMQGSNGLQPPLNAIKIEAPSYYCNSYTPPAPDHSSSMLQGAGAYS